MSPTIYISFAISPVLILVGMLILRTTFKIKNWVNIRNAVLLGMVSALLVLLANYMADMRWQGEFRNLKRIVVFVFVIIAFSSEFGKYLALRLGFYKLKNFWGSLKPLFKKGFHIWGLFYKTAPKPPKCRLTRLPFQC